MRVPTCWGLGSPIQIDISSIFYGYDIVKDNKFISLSFIGNVCACVIEVCTLRLSPSSKHETLDQFYSMLSPGHPKEDNEKNRTG